MGSDRFFVFQFQVAVMHSRGTTFEPRRSFHEPLPDPRPRELLLRPTRRNVLQGAGALAGATALGLGTGASMAQDNVLNILTWPGHGDPAFVKPFEDEHGVKVVAKEYVGGEPMLALMNQSPPGSFDVVLADAEYIGMLQDGGFIDALDPADYPLADYWPEFQKFPLHWVNDELYSVMIRFGYLGLAYRTDMLAPEDVTSYEALWNEKVKGKVGFFDWYLPTMGCLSLYDGNASPFDIDDTAYEKLSETLFLRPQTSGFYSMADQFAMLTNGTAAVIPGIGDWVVLLLQNEAYPWTPSCPSRAASSGPNPCPSSPAPPRRIWPRSSSSMPARPRASSVPHACRPTGHPSPTRRAGR